MIAGYGRPLPHTPVLARGRSRHRAPIALGCGRFRIVLHPCYNALFALVEDWTNTWTPVRGRALAQELRYVIAYMTIGLAHLRRLWHAERGPLLALS